MDERTMQFRVGVMVFATLLITAILVTMFGKFPLHMGKYTVRLAFPHATGVREDTPVRKSGILIGRVSRVELVTDEKLLEKGLRVIVTAEIEKDKPVYANEDCYIFRELVGDSYLTFIPDPRKKPSTEPLPTDYLLVGRVSEDPTGLISALDKPIATVTDTGLALKQASLELGGAAKNIKDLLDEKTQEDLKKAISNASVSLGGLSKVIGDEETQDRLREAMRGMPDTLKTMNETFKKANESLAKLTERSGPDQKTAVERLTNTIALAEKTMARTEAKMRQFTEPSAPGRPAPADQLFRTLDDLHEVMTKINAFADKLNSDQGTLGQLVSNPEVYQHLNRAAKNIDELTRQLKPIVNDVRELTDKVSRHPGVILRDAVKPGPGIKGGVPGGGW